MFETLSIESRDHIATVTLTEATMKPEFFAETAQAFEQLSEDSELCAVVVRSESKHFTYGLDLPSAAAEMGEALQGGGARTRTELLRTIRRLQTAFTRIADCPVPVIAAVHGWCIGGGIDLITACDLRLCSADAKFSVRETKIAIVADLGTLQRLPRVVGPGHARELAYTGKDITAERARAIGLVNDVLPDRAALDAAAQAMAGEIAENPPLTVRGVKEVLDYSAEHGVADGLDYVAAWNAAFLASEDLGEAMSAFLQKRKPAFKGR
jgi:enoyl-CoA hydratase